MKAGAFHAVLLGGGSGTRFWPLSRAREPKQLLALASRRPLVEDAWRRVRRLAPAERTWIVAPRALRAGIARALPKLRPGNLIVEPSARDTGPAIALACAIVRARDPEAIVGFFPTDHVVRDEAAFGRAVQVAIRAARSGALVCLGIRPDRPATGFGYLECAGSATTGRAIAVSRFVEKPDLARARRFLRSGRHLWNAGMFVWRADRFLEELERTAPEIRRAIDRHLAGKRGAWDEATRLSVDYAVMERARGVRVVALDAGWDDVGSWDAAARLREERELDGRSALLVDSAGSVVFGARRLVALVDAPGVVVVDTPDALLVVARRSSEKVRRVVEALRERGRTDLL